MNNKKQKKEKGLSLKECLAYSLNIKQLFVILIIKIIKEIVKYNYSCYKINNKEMINTILYNLKKLKKISLDLLS